MHCVSPVHVVVGRSDEDAVPRAIPTIPAMRGPNRTCQFIVASALQGAVSLIGIAGGFPGDGRSYGKRRFHIHNRNGLTH